MFKDRTYDEIVAATDDGTTPEARLWAELKDARRDRNQWVERVRTEVEEVRRGFAETSETFRERLRNLFPLPRKDVADKLTEAILDALVLTQKLRAAEGRAAELQAEMAEMAASEPMALAARFRRERNAARDEVDSWRDNAVHLQVAQIRHMRLLREIATLVPEELQARIRKEIERNDVGACVVCETDQGCHDLRHALAAVVDDALNGRGGRVDGYEVVSVVERYAQDLRGRWP